MTFTISHTVLKPISPSLSCEFPSISRDLRLTISTNWDLLLGTHMSREEAESRTRKPGKVEKME